MASVRYQHVMSVMNLCYGKGVHNLIYISFPCYIIEILLLISLAGFHFMYNNFPDSTRPLLYIHYEKLEYYE